jgi:UDP-glucose 4-epimerase
MERLLITGINGFIGSHAAAHFSKRFAITGLDTGPSDQTGCARVYRPLTLPCRDLAALVREIRPEVCVHCAGPASVPLSFEHPENDFTSGPAALANLLEALRREAPECLVVFPSSAAVYGNPEKLPVREDAPLKPISPYGSHKLVCEKLLEEYREHYGIRSVILRIFSCYGPGLRKQLLWDIARQIREKGRVELSGTGEETRDFINVADVVRAMESMMDGKQPFDVCNVASGIQTTVKEIALEILRNFKLPENALSFNGMTRKGDPIQWEADITRLRSAHDTPTMSLKNGVREFCEWSKFR